MGWTGTFVQCIGNSPNSKERKAELDNLINWGNKQEVVKSAMISTTYYAAVKIKETNEIYGLVILTQGRQKGDTYGCNFYYKDMSETCLPGYYDCPKGILDLLSPTDNEYALEWRKKCRESKGKKKNNIIKDLPYGAKVIWHRYDGQDTTLIKRPPSYQFKTWWWQIDGEQRYVSKKRVTEDRIEVIA